MTITLETLREIAFALPGVEEGMSTGTTIFLVKGKILMRLYNDNETLAMKMEENERAFLVKAEPDVYYVTEHYLNWPMVLIRLSNIDRADLAHHLEQAWRRLAPKRLVKDFDQQRSKEES